MQSLSPVRKQELNMSKPDQIKVMVVDDALVVRGMVTRFLEESDDLAVVVSVGDGERALAALDRHEVDVIVLDIEMPKMDGLTALPKLLEKSPGVQIVMASTLTLHNAEISLRALSLGAADYVPKPSSGGEIRNRDDFKRELTEKVRTLGRVGRRRRLLREKTRAGGPAPAAGTSAAALAAKREPGLASAAAGQGKAVTLRGGWRSCKSSGYYRDRQFYRRPSGIIPGIEGFGDADNSTHSDHATYAANFYHDPGRTCDEGFRTDRNGSGGW